MKGWYSNINKYRILIAVTILFIIAHFIMVRRNKPTKLQQYDYSKELQLLEKLKFEDKERSDDDLLENKKQNFQLSHSRKDVGRKTSNEDDFIKMPENKIHNNDRLHQKNRVHSSVTLINSSSKNVLNSSFHQHQRSNNNSAEQDKKLSLKDRDKSLQQDILRKNSSKKEQGQEDRKETEQEVEKLDTAVRNPQLEERFSSSKCKKVKPIFVKAEGNFTNRVTAYNEAISKLRRKILAARGEYKPWRNVAKPENLTVIWGARDDFLSRLCERPEAQMIMLKWSIPSNLYFSWSSLSDQSNVLLQKYYKWTGSETLCMWISTRGFTKARFDTVYDLKCDVGPLESTKKRHKDPPISLEYVYLNYKTVNPSHYWPNDGDAYPRWFHDAPPPFVFYMHVVQDAVVNTVGDVIAGSVKIVPYTCSHDPLPTIPMEYPTKPIYTEVFVLTQFWGTTYFHKLLEVMPRVAPYIEFLRNNPSVHVHTPEDRARVSEYLAMFGVNPERVVTGIVRAKVVYLPQGTPCGFPLTLSTQVNSFNPNYALEHRTHSILSRLFRTYILNNLFSPSQNQVNSENTNLKSSGLGQTSDQNSLLDQRSIHDQNPSHDQTPVGTIKPERKSLVYVRRGGLRKFLADAEMDRMLASICEEFNLKYVVFTDNPSPTLEETMRIFYSALIVVGPHGAGLSNIVFSLPGTVVIEGVCNPPHVNMCYQMAAHGLGMRYHGVGSRGGCERVVEVDPEDIEKVLRYYIPVIVKDLEKSTT